MNRCRPPSSEITFFVMPGYWVSRLVRTSDRVAPSAPTFASPPACLRRIVGSFTVTAMVGWSPVGRSVLRGDAAEQFVVDQLGDGWVLAADRTVRIPADLHFLEVHVQGVVQQQPAHERV